MNEADTCRIHITPSLRKSGWGIPYWRLAEQHYFTDGQVYLVGDGHNRRKGKKADYLLRYTESFPIAVVEAKSDELEPATGLQQAKEYAQILGLYFAYSSNGLGIEEWDFTTNTQCSLITYPTPAELWGRLCTYKAMEFNHTRNPLLEPYCLTNGKRPRYYQEVAINRAIEVLLQGQRRILINLATGTGKTVIALQIAWKLWKSKWNVENADRQPRVLFLADRNVLRDQAYNTFEPFDTQRSTIDEGLVDLNRTMYFSIYQAMYAGQEGKRLYQKYPHDFFDLIIIDEAHRSGFGTWNAILQYFDTAVQLGMTATPKRTENIDTYRYFGDPVFTYSLGQGIDDGFLATYKVHRTLTNFTRDGLVLQDVAESGAEIDIPDKEIPAYRYDLPDYERKITMPDHISQLSAHLSGLLHSYGRMEKTMVFCVNQEHALAVATELNRLNADLNVSDYAVRIVSEEGATGKALLEKFQNTEIRTPVVAVTVDLLTTGVDAPSVRNVVFMKPVSSLVTFKQIIGRGSRLCADTDKFWFRVIDYTNASRLFDEWDSPGIMGEGGPATSAPFTCLVAGRVTDGNGKALGGVHIIVQTNPNDILDQRTGPDGQFLFMNVGQGQILMVVTATDYKRVQRTYQTSPHEPLVLTISLHASGERTKQKRIRITGLDVQFVDETYEERDAEGKLVSPEDYLNKVREEVLTVCHSLLELQRAWVSKPRRDALMQELEDRLVHIDILRELLLRPDADSFDLVAHIGFGEHIYSREERTVALFNLHRGFFYDFEPDAREILFALVEKYRYGGLSALSDPTVFTLAPFNSNVSRVAMKFGGIAELRRTIDDLVRRLYIPTSVTEAA